VTSPTHAGGPGAASWFDAGDPPNAHDLSVCIHCGLCLTACPTYRELKIEPDSPRGRIDLMRGLASGRIGPSPELVHHLDQCLGCRACEPVCPAGVPYGRMLEATRGQLARRDGHPTLARRLGTTALRVLFPNRGLMHAVADLLRAAQSGPLRSLLESRWGRSLTPDLARRGMAMTPRLEPRGQRRLERIAASLPAGASMTSEPGAVVFRPAGSPRARIGFFTSCVMEVLFPRVNQEAVRLLVVAGAEVIVPRDQTCCGALHAHAGERDEAKRLVSRNVRAFGSGLDAIVTDSAGCGAALREAGHLLGGSDATSAEAFAGKVRDVSQVLARLELPPAQTLANRVPLRVAYHDPCHLAHAQGVKAEPRALLRRIPGVELVDLPNSDWCCGSAGIYNLTHPEMAEAQLRHKLDSIDEVQPDLVVASNPGCLMHMARGARERGQRAPIVHLVDVLARAWPAGSEDRQIPSKSEALRG
jgi:glycolate oxidase iron-sulfur subunit